MSRERNKREPFHATHLQGMTNGCRGIVRELDGVFGRSGLNDILWPGSGWRTGSVEHVSGTAVDWMIVARGGMRPTTKEREAALKAIAWLVKNRAALQIEGILFSRDGGNRTEAIGYSQPFERGWRSLSPRGSVSADHIDHFHIKFKDSASWPSSLNGSVIGPSTVTPKPSVPSTGATGPTPPKAKKSVLEMAKEVVAQKHGNGHTARQRSLGIDNSTYALVRAEVNRLTNTKVDPPRTVPPFPTGIGPNKSRPSAKVLQAQLQRAGLLGKKVALADNYGPLTQSAVARFHERHPQFKNRNTKKHIAIGPLGWKYLFERY